MPEFKGSKLLGSSKTGKGSTPAASDAYVMGARTTDINKVNKRTMGNPSPSVQDIYSKEDQEANTSYTKAIDRNQLKEDKDYLKGDTRRKKLAKAINELEAKDKPKDD